MGWRADPQSVDHRVQDRVYGMEKVQLVVGAKAMEGSEEKDCLRSETKLEASKAFSRRDVTHCMVHMLALM